MATVVVKIAVAVDPTGQWNAVGWPASDNLNDCNPQAMDIAASAHAEGEARYWVTAVLQVPEVEIVEGKVIEYVFDY